MDMKLNFDSLKSRHREIRDNLPQTTSLRIHRSLSWLQRAEEEENDDDARFIFLWIAFNAAYANEIHDRARFTERRIFIHFLGNLINADEDNLIYTIIWQSFPKSIRLIIDNQYVFQPFWSYHNSRINEDDWLRQFEKSKASINRAMGRMDTKKVLAILFDRLYVLRNQLIHGGATWNSSVNRRQVRDGAEIMSRLVPTIVHLMLERPAGFIGEPTYPVVS
jgi:hypothetical protein